MTKQELLQENDELLEVLRDFERRSATFSTKRKMTLTKSSPDTGFDAVFLWFSGDFARQGPGGSTPAN